MTEKTFIPRLVFTITNLGNEKKLREVFDETGAAFTSSLHGQGTAPSEMMDLFGLSGRTKLITAGVILKDNVHSLFRLLDERLAFSQKGKGIAFTMSLSSMQSRVLALIGQEGEKITKDSEDNDMNTHTDFSAIIASVINGYSEDVVEAARSAGATGGTILKGLREGTREVAEALCIPVKDEQEMVLILIKNEKKAEVLSAITEKCGINTDAKGTVIAFKLDEVFGI